MKSISFPAFLYASLILGNTLLFLANASWMAFKTEGSGLNTDLGPKGKWEKQPFGVESPKGKFEDKMVMSAEIFCIIMTISLESFGFAQIEDILSKAHKVFHIPIEFGGVIALER